MGHNSDKKKKNVSAIWPKKKKKKTLSYLSAHVVNRLLRKKQTKKTEVHPKLF